MRVFALPLLLLAGCAQGRVAQCNQFVDVYNRTAPEIAKAGGELADPKATPETVYATLSKLGELEGTLATETEALRLEDQDLAVHLADFVATAKRIQESMTAAVTAGKAGDPNAAIVALANYSRYAGDQDQKIAEIKAYCAGEPPPPKPAAFAGPDFPADAAARPASAGGAGAPGAETTAGAAADAVPADAAFTPVRTKPDPTAKPLDPGADAPQDEPPPAK